MLVLTIGDLQMKKLVFLVVFFIIFGAFCVHIAMNRHYVVDTTTQPSPEAEHTPQNKSIQPVLKTEAAIVSDEPNPDELENEVVNTERLTDDTDKPEEQVDNDQQGDDVSLPKQEQTGPLADYIADQQAKENGTWIGDPEKMDPDELHSAIYNQLLEQFGDIPEVHAVMEYSRKWDNNIRMTVDEEIEGLEAKIKLFPSESARKTLAYAKWRRSRGGASGYVGDITPDDIAHLRSLGISVKENVTESGYTVNISTK